MEPTETSNTSPAIPIAIIVGFGMIALAIFFTNRGTTEVAPVVATNEDQIERFEEGTPSVVDENDYIKGNPNAPILIIEYSDYDCPFCKQFHNTMNLIMDEYGVNGQVAWVYRQFPISQLHPNSPKISEAALCVGELGGSDAFWKFTDKIFEERNVDAPTNVTRLPEYALEAGISQSEYISCLNSGRHQDEVLASAEEAFRIGARGTPYSVVMVGNQQAVINGAQPYEVVAGVVENLVAQLEGNAATEIQPLGTDSTEDTN